jgi:DNA-binding transcriptional ArsR family regulator
VVEDQKGIDTVFHALSSEVRRDMLGRLAAGELTVGQLAAPLTMSLAAASKHIQVLEKAGLLHRTVSGRQHVCRLEAAPLAPAFDWLRFYQSFWGERLDALHAMFESGPAAKEQQ